MYSSVDEVVGSLSRPSCFGMSEMSVRGEEGKEWGKGEGETYEVGREVVYSHFEALATVGDHLEGVFEYRALFHPTADVVERRFVSQVRE